MGMVATEFGYHWDFQGEAKLLADLRVVRDLYRVTNLLEKYRVDMVYEQNQEEFLPPQIWALQFPREGSSGWD